MSTNDTGIRCSYEEYKILSASSDQRYELIDGELYMSPSPTVRHQIIVTNLVYLLEHYVRSNACGRVLTAPLDVVLGDGDERHVVQPDVIFVPAGHAVAATDEVVGPPGLIVEVLSPGTSGRDRRIKKALYARSGVGEYWIVDPASEWVEVFRLGRTGYAAAGIAGPGDRLVSAVIPGFEVDVAEVFRGLP